MRGLIYKITNDVNHYCYIEQTITSLSHRWSEHKQSINDFKKVNNKLYAAMRTIGVEHFSITLVEEYNNITQEQLDEKEQYWIEYYNSFYNGYNSTKGGTFGSRTIKAILCYTLSGQFYKKYETIQEAADDLSIDYEAITTCLSHSTQESCGGFQFKYEDSDKIIKDLSNLSNFNAKKVYYIQYDLNGFYINHFTNIQEASEKTGCLTSGIIRCARGKLHYTNNSIWRYGFFGEPISKKIDIKPITNTNKGKSKTVIFIDENNKETLYKSLSEAAKLTGYSRHKITYNCDIYPKTTLEKGAFKYGEG